MTIQAVLFDRTKYTTQMARRWLQHHDITPLKRVHATKNFYRYRITQPNKEKRHRTKQITDGITLIIEY